jgi:hypothetical protein
MSHTLTGAVGASGATGDGVTGASEDGVPGATGDRVAGATGDSAAGAAGVGLPGATGAEEKQDYWLVLWFNLSLIHLNKKPCKISKSDNSDNGRRSKTFQVVVIIFHLPTSCSFLS